MLKQQSHIVAPIPDELRTRALYTVSELKSRGKADKQAIEQLYDLINELTEAGLEAYVLERKTKKAEAADDATEANAE